MSALVEVKTEGLSGAALDWAVAIAGEYQLDPEHAGGSAYTVISPEGAHTSISTRGAADGFGYRPSADWSQGGPLIESGELTVEPSAWDWKGACVLWRSQAEGESIYFEHTNPLVAAMRAFAHSKLGPTVGVPKELLA